MITVKTGVSEPQQESSFMNATLQGFGDNHAISIAVILPATLSQGVDMDDAERMRALFTELFSSAIARGCEIEIQCGPSRAA